MTRKVVIIGSGPAGWSAAIYAARANLQPLVFEGDGLSEINRQNGTIPLGQLSLTTEVENFASWPSGDIRQYLKTALPPESQPYWVTANKPQPAHGIQGPELMELMRQQAKNFGTEVLSRDIVKVDFSKKPFVMVDHTGETTEAHAIILATGARANYLGLPSEDRFKNQGVSACAVCDGALPRFRNKPLAVIGGGDSAVEEATYLTKFAEKVYLIVRRHELRASKIMQQRALDNPKIDIQWETVVEEVLGSDDAGVTGIRVKNVKSNDIRELPVAGMFCAIGHTPNTKFLDGQLELTDKGYIVWTTRNRTYTSVEGVFAAGDVADDYYRQAISAAGTGCMAALDAERWLAHHNLV
ncbi:NAD(P)/FAD-dependent oxidoreductase [Tuwongella immobilis]|uniref:FAD/NAD(P)-binding domain-containing protein n=1 Tax=Tuwongella immobilis TaxID=692036 RepID=A0A6C2YIY1_9BACT|nr:thioredoxin-disulfide reductase [Tuwongella immobilis]VIP01093.1 thioredoxin reductase : Thioredoxin reductase OS=Planctomyces limnophilus (strain ATCC 43296 / DSM 3776 / IFAM 1008 / 290) GN=Plim_1633 PE=3 SV=1: Pyr_redox_2: Pyr_redox [Tuwongella immobilis]VTR97611.1 thioredoxin reductase : Thioredoxin reductase OS=Planctomyces limnophilus (strain ATCC 43296 / DSM 3776 / IFAM 1008 / 290) GN=Plim_1633 PE=3 SV=1: Pyr_redox_2: Pyr_redox [Tuwongella immobilis]